MEIRYLKEFLTLAKELNYTNAAESLYISQPVLSKHIKALETELEAMLFYRSARKVTLTEFGRKYVECAERIVREYERSEKERKDYIAETNRTISLGAILNFQDFGLDRHLIRFSKMHPNFRFEMIEASDMELLSLFREGKLNMFTAGILNGVIPDFDYIPINTGSMYVYINTSDPLSEHDTLRLNDLNARQIFLPYRGTELLSWVEDIAAKEGVILNSKYYGSQEAAKVFVKAGMGIAIVHMEDGKQKEYEEAKAIKLSPSIDYSIGLGYRHNNLGKAESEFLKYAMKASKFAFEK